MRKRECRKLISLLLILCMRLTAIPASADSVELSGSEMTKVEQQASTVVEQQASTVVEQQASTVVEQPQLSATAQILSEDCKILNYVHAEVFSLANHVARLTSEETLSSYVFLNEDGTRTAYFMDEAVKFVDANGIIQEKDLTLVPTVGGYTTEKNDIELTLPTDPSKGITLLWNNTAVRIIPQGGTVGEAVVEDNTVRYVDYYGNGADLVYTPTLSGLKEDIILESYAGKNTFTFMLNTGGLRLYSANGRYFLAASKTATERIELGDVVSFDARGRFSVGTMTAQTVTAGQIYRLTLTVDEAFLTDPNTVYPVSIDPTLEVSDNNAAGSIEDVSIYQGKPTTNGNWTYLHSGYYDSNYTVSRTLFRLTGLISSSVYQELNASQINSVEFHIWEASGTAATNVSLRANTGSATWTESGATWNNAGVTLGATYDTRSVGINAQATFDITQLVKDWKSGTQNAQKGFVLQSSNETSRDKAFYSSEHSTTSKRPYVVVEYSPTQEAFAMQDTVIRVNEGETKTIQMVTTLDDPEYTWSSSDTSVATVSSTGTVTGVKAGVTTITASAFGMSASCTVYVTLSENAVYRIRNTGTAVFLDCNGANIAEDNLTNVQVQSMISIGNDRLAQMWRIIYIGGGFYHIRPMHKLDYALYLDGADVKLKNIGTAGNITSENANARWTIEYINGGYVFKNVGNNARTLQPFGGSTAAGSFVNAYTYNASAQYQRWSVTTMTLPPSGVLLYNNSTGLPVNNGTVNTTYLPGNPITLSAAVYTVASITQTVSWSAPILDASTISNTITISAPCLTSISCTSTAGTTATATIQSMSFATMLAYNDGEVDRAAYIENTDSHLANLSDSRYSYTFTSLSVDEVSSFMQSCSLFYVHTHGQQNAIELGTDNIIDSAELSVLDLSNIEFALLLACSTGKGGYDPANVTNNTPTNVVERMVCCGAETVIGFNDEVPYFACNTFAALLTRCIYAQGMTVSEAVEEANYDGNCHHLVSKTVIGGDDGSKLD